MKRKVRVFNSDEIGTFKDIRHQHMQAQKMTDREKKYWQRKPYDVGKGVKI